MKKRIIETLFLAIIIFALQNFTSSSYAQQYRLEDLPLGSYVSYSANNYNKWKIISNESNYVKIITEGVVGSLNLYGIKGYYFASDNMEAIAARYKNSYYAAYSQTPKLIDVSGIINSGSAIGTPYWLNEKEVVEKRDRWHWGSYYYNYYYNVKTLENTNVRDKTLVIKNRYYTNMYQDIYDGERNSSYVSKYSYTYSIRPIVILKGWIYVEGGNGTRDNPYILKRSTSINLTARADNKENCVVLNWSQADKVHSWRYQVFQKNVRIGKWEQVSLADDENDKVRVLSVYPPANEARKLRRIVDNYGLGRIELTEVGIGSFNSNPYGWLSNNYDVVVFGFNYYNGPPGGMGDSSGQDISGSAVSALRAYAKNGGSIILGPDTAMQWRHSGGCGGNKNKGHRGFQDLAGGFGIGTSELKSRENSMVQSGSSAVILKSGSITRYPYTIGNQGEVYDTFPIGQTHNCKMSWWNSNIWVGYSRSVGDYNWYLRQSNNIAVCTMGVSNNITEYDSKLMVNLLIALKQRSNEQEKDYIIKSASDVDAPDRPSGVLWHLEGSDTKHLFRVYEPKDNGTTYDHCVVGTYSTGLMLPQDIANAIQNGSALADNMIKSNITRTTVTTGLKGYSYTITKNANDNNVDNKIDELKGSQKDVPESYRNEGYVKEGETYITIPSAYINNGYYLHIRAIDYAGNASAVYHIKLDYTKRTLMLESSCKIASEVDTRGIAKNPGDNKIDLRWKIEPAGDFRYILYEREVGETDYEAINYDKTSTSRRIDTVAPERPQVIIKASTIDTKSQLPLNIEVKAPDRGIMYEHYVVGISKQTGEPIWSNAVRTEILTGTKGFSYVIDNNEYTIPDDEIDTLGRTIDRKYIGQYLHIKALDYAGNASETTHVYIDDGYKIPYEELNNNDYLYCIQNGQAIPAIDKETGVKLNATVTAGAGIYALKIYALNPVEGDVIGRRFVEGQTSNIYGTLPIRTYSIVRYYNSKLTPPRQDLKEGNADEKEGYILSYYKENTSVNSESQEAIYTTEISKDAYTDIVTVHNKPEPAKDTELSIEADLYSEYRDRVKYNYEPIFYANNGIDEYWNGDIYNSVIYVGPFKVFYDRSFAKVGSRDKVEFNYIDSFELYNLDGSLITNHWEFAYDHDRVMRKYDEDYKYPYPNEEFYIKLNYTDDIKGIKNIIIKYKELVTDAEYTVLEGTYNTVDWIPNRIYKNSPDSMWCTQVEDGALMCVHGQRRTHIIGAYFYLTANIVNPGGNALESQKLLKLEWMKRWYHERVQNVNLKDYIDNKPEDPNNPDGPNKPDNSDDPDNPNTPDEPYKLTFDISGNIWDDQNENVANGLREENEQAVKNVIVRAYKVDYNGRRISNQAQAETYTDKNGNYTLYNLPVHYYDVEFEYDGQTYISTKFMINRTTGQSDSVATYSKDYKTAMSETYARSSKVKETVLQRQELNDRYAEISKFGAISNKNEKTELEYKTRLGESKIVTLDNKGFSKKQYSIYPTTVLSGLRYPIADITKFQFGSVGKIKHQNYVNIGLAEREKTDENLRLDVYETTFSIKGQKQSYIHSGKNIRDINSVNQVSEYIQKVNRADYEWSLSQYEIYDEYEQIKEILGDREQCELSAYVDYMMVIRNNGENDIVRIAELVDYYDKTLQYSNSGYRDIPISSWAVVRTDEETEASNSVNNTRVKLEWTETSKYGDTNEYPEFNKIYTTSLDNELCQFEKGQYLEVHLIFEVKKDEKTGKILLDSEQTAKKNFSEINGYKTFYRKNENLVFAGLIDYDSQPGNLNPYNDLEAYEDDEDKAPDYKMIIDDTMQNNNNNGSEDSDNSNDNNSNSNSDNEDKGNRDENGEFINYGNVIEGNVWEDIRKKREDYTNEPNTLTLDNKQIIADGIRQEEEPLINNVKVQLMEVFRGTVTNEKGEQENKEVIIKLKNKEKRTKNVKSLTNLDENEDSIALDGGYRYTNLPAGTYKVEFTYGDEEALKDDVKYNGEDYQAIDTADIYKNIELTDDYSNTEILFVIDDSNSMKDDKLSRAKEMAKDLIVKLEEKLPKVKIGIIAFNENATVISSKDGKLDKNALIDNLKVGGNTSIASAFKLVSEQYDTNIKNKLMIMLTDGQETVQTNEDVIKALEDTVDNYKVKLSTILTSVSEQIFGTMDEPRRGNLYLINDKKDLEDIITEDVYNKVVEESYLKNDRSYGRDLEGNLDKPEKGTRSYILTQFETIATEKAELLNIEAISKLDKESEERKEKVKALANETYMVAETNEVKIKANVVGKTHADQVNLSLVLRPEAELKTTEEITGVKVTLNDGEVIIDTAKGVTKNVQGLDKEDTPILIQMDEELMQGAEVQITYKIKVENIGEIDRLSNYFREYADKEKYESTIETYPEVIYDYVNSNIIYREDYQEDKSIWKSLGNANLSDYRKELNQTIEDSVKEQNIVILRNIDGTKVALYPESSKEVEEGKGEKEWNFMLVLSKIISPNDEKDILVYNNSLEIMQRKSIAGRRSVKGVTGNYIPNSETDENDSAKSRYVKIIPPTGGVETTTSIIIIAIIVLSVVAVIIVVIKIKLR